MSFLRAIARGNRYPSEKDEYEGKEKINAYF